MKQGARAGGGPSWSHVFNEKNRKGESAIVFAMMVEK